MKAKEELEKILAHEAVLECLEEQLARLESAAEKVTASMDGEMVSRTRNTDPLGDAYAAIEKKRNEIQSKQAEHDRLVEYYQDIINNLRRPIFIKVLYGCYFLGKSLVEIADEEGYCYRHICNLKGNALQAVENARKTKES